MHFVTGGAFNGKRKWVSRQYPNAKWISAYKDEPLPEDLSTHSFSSIILEGLEIWVKNFSSRDEGKDTFRRLLQWEEEDDTRRVIIIGTDISKGIVPMEKENRAWRDMTGWVYQDAVALSEQVDIIWYGINQRIKG